MLCREFRVRFGWWKAKARRLVTEGNIHKLSQYEILQLFLRSSGDTVLVEASPRDCICGIGLGKDNPRALDPVTLRRPNLIGFAFMGLYIRCAIDRLEALFLCI